MVACNRVMRPIGGAVRPLCAGHWISIGLSSQRRLRFGLLLGIALGQALLARGQELTDVRSRGVLAGTLADREFERQVYVALDRIASIDHSSLTVEGLLSLVSQQTGIALAIDKPSLEAAGIAVDREIALSPGSMPVRAMLDIGLRQCELTWAIRDDRVLITTMAQAETLLTIRVYEVLDLVRSEDQQGEFLDFDALTEVISSSVDPTTWEDVGGAASIKPFYNAGSLVIRQTCDGHEQIAGLLDALRVARREVGRRGPTSRAG